MKNISAFLAALFLTGFLGLSVASVMAYDTWSSDEDPGDFIHTAVPED